MKPVSPVMPGFSEPYEFLLAENQKQYLPIPTVVTDEEEKRFWSRWEFTEDERRKITEGGSLILQQLTFGHPFQPVAFIVVSKERNDPAPLNGIINHYTLDDKCLCNGVGCARCCGPS